VKNNMNSRQKIAVIILGIGALLLALFLYINRNASTALLKITTDSDRAIVTLIPYDVNAERVVVSENGSAETRVSPGGYQILAEEGALASFRTVSAEAGNTYEINLKLGVDIVSEEIGFQTSYNITESGGVFRYLNKNAGRIYELSQVNSVGLPLLDSPYDVNSVVWLDFNRWVARSGNDLTYFNGSESTQLRLSSSEFTYDYELPIIDFDGNGDLVVVATTDGVYRFNLPSVEAVKISSDYWDDVEVSSVGDVLFFNNANGRVSGDFDETNTLPEPPLLLVESGETSLVDVPLPTFARFSSDGSYILFVDQNIIKTYSLNTGIINDLGPVFDGGLLNALVLDSKAILASSNRLWSLNIETGVLSSLGRLSNLVIHSDAFSLSDDGLYLLYGTTQPSQTKSGSLYRLLMP
jgi:hypothetical protein